MKVAVVGAGLAGLRSAMLLEAGGHEVMLFEARDRPGGRLHTAPSGFEEGAEWVDADHDRMRSLMRALGIAEVPAPEGEYLLQYRSERAMESQMWPSASEDLRRFAELARTEPTQDTIGDLVDSACQSDVGRWLVTANVRTDEGDEPSRLGLQPWLAFRRMYAHREGSEASAYRIDGGGSAFVRQMLGKIRAVPKYGSRLIRVDGTKLIFEGFEVTVDAVVLALPLPCLLALQIDPPLSTIAELQGLGFAPALKARFRFALPFWKDDGWQGYLKSDTRIQQTWPDREDSQSLVGYIVGDDARTLGSSADIEGDLRRAWRTLGVEPGGIEVKNWTADPFAGGAFSLALPGSDPAAIRVRDSGPIQYAGEFAATWMGFMEGALESAETAVSALS
ncbi:MAG: NAD(P)/FAD-dependent oxidoreductase [Fimbriimonadales bacterium]